jgi:quercetin dioxygenase-like cupin family protein
MTTEKFFSPDFWRVSGQLSVSLPDKLLHKGVMSGHAEGAEHFSAERKHPVHIVDLPSHTISMTLGGLLPSQTTSRHRHNYETVIYVIEGTGSTMIEDQLVHWSAGDAIYIPVWAWHHHSNASDIHGCTYVACENAPLLQNLGGIALREEQG